MAEPGPTHTVVVQPPGTVMEMGGQSLSHVTTALGAQPVLLAVVLINFMFAGMGGYFLLKLEEYRSHNTSALIALMEKCILGTAPISEFDRYREPPGN